MQSVNRAASCTSWIPDSRRDALPLLQDIAQILVDGTVLEDILYSYVSYIELVCRDLELIERFSSL